MFLSILVIENGVFVNEQGRNGEFVYANFYLLFYYIISIVSFIFFFKLFDKLFKLNLPKIKFVKIREKQLLLIIAISVLLLALINLMLSPSVYNSTEISKFNYWKYAKFPFLKGLLGSTIGYFPFIMGIFYKRYKKITLILAVFYLIYLIGIDQKFTALLFGGIAFMVSYIILNFNLSNKIQFSFKKKYLIIVGALLFSVVLIKYTKKNPYEYLKLTPLESVFYRAFGLQGHLFWGTSEKYIYNENVKTWNINELPYGMHVLMKDFAPSYNQKHLAEAWERGVSWTNAYPAILNRVFPLPVAYIVHFFLFSIIPFLYCLLVKSLRNKNFLLSVVLFQTILWSVNVYSTAFFYRLIKVGLIITAIIYVCYLINKSRVKIP